MERSAARTANPAGAKQLGVLLASGMLVGDGLTGVILAALVVFSGSGVPLALVGAEFADAAAWIGGAVFAASILGLYAWINRRGGRAG